MFKTCSGLILTTEKVNLSDIHRRMQVIFFYFVMKRLMKLLWIGGQKYFVNRKLTKGILRMNLAVVDQFLWLMRSINSTEVDEFFQSDCWIIQQHVPPDTLLSNCITVKHIHCGFHTHITRYSRGSSELEIRTRSTPSILTRFGTLRLSFLPVFKEGP